MKWLVVILVILNLAVYLFAQRINPGASEFADSGRYETVNPEVMTVIEPGRSGRDGGAENTEGGQMLEEEGMAQLKMDTRGQVLMAPQAAPEVEETGSQPIVVAGDPAQSSAPSEEPKSSPSTAAMESGEEAAGSEPESAAKTAPAAAPAPILSCYRIGPFSQQKSLAAARRELEKQGIDYTVDEDRDKQKIKAVRVYLGAFTSDSALQAEKKKLEGLGVEHFVIRLNSTPMIQLGYFSEPARASAYQEKLKARGLQVKTEKIYHDAAITSWLDVPQATREGMDRLKLPKAMIQAKPSCP